MYIIYVVIIKQNNVYLLVNHIPNITVSNNLLHVVDFRVSKFLKLIRRKYY